MAAESVEAVKQALLVDARRPKKERRTAKALFKQIGEAGYDGGYSRCVFRKSVTGVFGIVTDDFGNVTGHFGEVTNGPSLIS